VFDRMIDAQTFSDYCQQLNVNVKVTILAIELLFPVMMSIRSAGLLFLWLSRMTMAYRKYFL
ncbi:MAG: hypothetical protein ACFFC7_23645, partial [Candidatus Hermodarchaeota archaeon]